MLIQVARVLDGVRLAACREALADADWVDGRVTAGHQSARAKDNEQLPEVSPLAQRLGDVVLSALERNALFMSAALPQRVYPPLFNRYRGGQAFGAHVDNAVRAVAGTTIRLRTDLSATLFLADPASYDGGELVIEHAFGHERIKLPAGDLVLYPASSLHHVTPVTHGERLASFFWVQSLVRDDGRRRVLFDLDVALQRLGGRAGNEAEVLQLTGVYHNLLRLWTEV